MPFFTTRIASDPWTVREVLVPGMKLSGWSYSSRRGFSRFIPRNLSLASIVASKGHLVPFPLTDILQTAALILQGNGLVNQSFEIWECVYDQLAS